MSEHDLLKISWEGEIFGVGMFETMAEMYPERADESTAGATMEWFNIHQCEEFGHAAGVHVSLEEAEKLGRQGAELASKNSWEALAKMVIKETPEADKMYLQLAKRRRHPRAEGVRGRSR
jgi:rubrerythrin